jgi:hypothetical protein
MSSSKETIIKDGKLVFHRHETRQDFFCERCQTNKQAKVMVDWYNLNNEKKIICNGCYGFLLSQK